MKTVTMAKKIKWMELVMRFETSSMNDAFVSLGKNKVQPYLEAIFSIRMKLGSSLYAHAYSVESPTKKMYENLWIQLKGLGKCSTPKELFIQNVLYEKALKTMPKGIRNWSIEGTGLLCINKKPITLKQAGQFL